MSDNFPLNYGRIFASDGDYITTSSSETECRYVKSGQVCLTWYFSFGTGIFEKGQFVRCVIANYQT